MCNEPTPPALLRRPLRLGRSSIDCTLRDILLTLEADAEGEVGAGHMHENHEDFFGESEDEEDQCCEVGAVVETSYEADAYSGEDDRQ